jgi:hypothetical protein
LWCGSIEKTTFHVFNHDKGLATTCWDGNTTDVSSQQRIKSTLLVGTEGQSHAVRC